MLKKINSRIKYLLILIVIFVSFFRFYELNIPDIIEDENGHVRDAIAYYHKDPFVVPRHHPYKHTFGNMAHPFFHHFLIYFSYQAFRPSNASSRLPAVIMSIISALAVYHLARKMFSEKTASIGLCLYLLSPLVFRISRTANVDNTFAALGGFSMYYFYKYLSERKLPHAFLTGFFSALMFSTRMIGVMIFVIFIIYIISLIIFRSIRLYKKDLLALLICALTFGIIFFLLNDPLSYLDGIIHPADPGYNTVFTDLLSFDWQRLKGTLIYLFPWHFTLLLLISTFIAIKEIIRKSKYYREYLLLIISLLIFFYGFRFSLERALIIFQVPACIIVAEFFKRHLNFNKPKHMFIALIYVGLFIPYIIWYGFRTKPLPFYPYDYVTHYYNNRLKIFKYLNNLPQDTITVSTLPSTLFFPDLNLRKGVDLIPVAFRNSATTDFFLTDNWEIYQTKLNDNKYELIIFNKYQNDIAALFKRRL